MRLRPHGERGQATVELVLVVPVLVILALFLVQVGFVVRSLVLVHHAAREGVRVAAVGGDPGRIREAVVGSSGLLPGATEVGRRIDGDLVTVTVTYRDPTDVPLVGALLPEVPVSAFATMRREAVDLPRARSSRGVNSAGVPQARAPVR
ncbi:MAG: pilus assembly protein [Actinobacteria bacterium]|nr:pilus assembly protein [Actinomycetota bacterium]